jgi:hypothetical protein
MNKIYIILLLTAIPLKVFCQQDDETVLESRISYQWDATTNEWIPEYRSEYTYDSNGNQIEEFEYGWDSETNDWVGYWRYISAYDDNGNRIDSTLYTWDDVAKDWTTFERRCHFRCWGGRYVFTYDSDGHRIETIWFDWDTLSKDWVDPISRIFTYDSAGHLIQEIGIVPTYWSIKNIRWDYKYDSNGYKIEEIGYWWDSETNDWVSDGRSVLAYDSVGNQIEWAHYEWDATTNEWVLDHRSEYTYDSNGNQTEKVEYGWDSQTNGWVDERSVWAYDSSGNQTEEIRYDWDSETSAWVGDRRYVWGYDSSGNQTEEIRYDWDSETNTWVGEWKEVSYWSNDLIWNQEFSVDENCSGSTSLGTLITGSKYPRRNITFNITSENKDNLFALDTVAGDIFLINSSELDYETTSRYSLTVEAQFEDSTGIISDTFAITIYVNNINDNPPIVNDTTFHINENSDVWTLLGTVIADDGDGGLNQLTFSIISGDDNHFFYFINYDKLYVYSLDYESQVSYTLTIQVSDGTFTCEATVTIHVLDVDETSVSDVTSSRLLKVYPNPVKDVLKLEVPERFTDGFEVEMVNSTGKVVFNETGVIEHIDVSNFQEGIYFIKIKAEESIIVRKIIIQK